MGALFKFILGLFGFGDAVKQQIDHAQVEEEGAVKQANIDQKAELDADEKEISDMRAQKDFSDRINSSPDELERMRLAVNADAGPNKT